MPASDVRNERESAAPLLEVRNLVTEVATPNGAFAVVDGASFAVQPGRTLGLVGESGSGKSLTCLSILKLLPANGRVRSGEIRLQGEDLTRKSDREMNALRGRRMGMILQDPLTSLNPLFTIGDQVHEMFRFHAPGLSRSERREAVIEVMRRVSIPDPEARLNSYPHQFSGGMRQRISIAINIARTPDLLIADEPTTALDVTIRLQILNLLRDIQRAHGTAIILVTHDLHMIGRYCDDVAVMYAGRIVEQGPVAQVFAAPRHPYTRGLLGAMPRLRGNNRRLTVIPGQPPAAGSFPSGCRFAPRCASASAACRTTQPALSHGAQTEQRVACWHPEEWTHARLARVAS